jgi:hypothetical protein
VTHKVVITNAAPMALNPCLAAVSQKARLRPVSEWATNRTESVERCPHIHAKRAALPSRCGGPFIGFRRAHAGSAIRSFRSTSFRRTLFLESVVFVVGELSYHAARVTSREDSIGNVACDHAARADDRP